MTNCLHRLGRTLWRTNADSAATHDVGADKSTRPLQRVARFGFAAPPTRSFRYSLGRHWTIGSGLLLSLLIALTVPAAFAQTELPALKLQTAPLVTPSTAVPYYQGLPTTHTTGVAAWTTRPPEIQELARALGAGRYTNGAYTSAVYEYVRNNVEIEFRFGLSKGARGALIDQSGTAFDQAHLMVELLRQGGVTASYQVGVLTLTGAQFTAWTGIADAAAACQYLADGGVPATVNTATSCASLSAGTPISAVALLHPWITTATGVYDPAYKIRVKKSGIDIAAAMGCGTAAAPTCGSSLLSTSLVPAATTSCSFGGASFAGVNCVTGVNQSGIETQLTKYAVALQGTIQSTNATNGTYLALEDVVGGLLIDVQQPTTSGSLLPTGAYGSPAFTWTGDIPDAFRTTFTVQVDQINQVLFADETAGNRIRLWGTAAQTAVNSPTATETFNLYSEYRLLATSTLTVQSPNPKSLLVAVQHPYAANGGTYAAETVSNTVLMLAWDCQFITNCDKSIWYTPTITIVAGFGEQSQNSVTRIADLQKRDLVNGPPWENPTDPRHIFLRRPQPPQGGIARCAQFGNVTNFLTQDNPCYSQEGASLTTSWLAESARARTLVGNINKVAFHHHHSLGIAMSGDFIIGTIATLQSMLSADSTTSNAADRAAAFSSAGALMNRLEGGVFEQTIDAYEGGAALSMMVLSNKSGIPFLDVTPTNAAAVASSLKAGATNNWNTTAVNTISAYATANPGYRLIVPANGWAGTYSLTDGSVLIYHGTGVAAFGSNGDRIAYLATLQPLGTGFSTLTLKGSAGAATLDPATSTEQSVHLADRSTKGRATYGVNLVTGELQLKPRPDLVTGTGDFPYSLPYQRVYTGTGTTVGYFTDGTLGQLSYPNDADPAAIGGGWTHSLAIKAEIQSDAFAAMGRDSGLASARVIAGLVAQRALANGTVDIRSRLATIFATHWTISGLNRNVVMVSRPPDRSTFAQLPDGTFDAGPGKAESLTQTGSPVIYGDTNGWMWDGRQVSFNLALKDGSSLSFKQMVPTLPAYIYTWPSSYPYVAQSWTFPSGINLAFNYTTTSAAAGLFRSCLVSVSNNLGRSLSFNDPCVETQFAPGGAQWVKDDAGRTVTYQSLPLSLGAGNLLTTLAGATGLQVTGPDGGVTQYDYVSSTATPSPRPLFGIYRWFTPSNLTSPYVTATFDTLFRVAALSDNSLPTANTTSYFLSGLSATQNQKRTDVVEATGALTTNYFDRWNNTAEVIDDLGNLTSYTYDAHHRLSVTTYPEGNWDQLTYDVRSNPLSTTHNPKPGSSLAPTVISTAYVEGPSVTTCANLAICNKPVTTKDANGNTTTYAYIPSTGLLQRTTGPSVTAQSGTGGASGSAQQDLCWGSFAGTTGSVSLLTAKIVRADPSPARVTSYTYNTASNHLTLATAIQDPGTTYLPPSAAGGACTTTTKSGALALTTAFSFDAVGNVQTIDGPIPGTSDVTTYSFDSMRRLTTVAAPLNALTRYCYDADGELVSKNRARVATTDPNTSNASGLASNGQCPTAFATANWQSEFRNYFPTGDLKSVTDAQGNTTLYAYDPDGRQQVVADPDGRQTATVYDPLGHKIATWRGGSAWVSTDGYQRPTAAANSLSSTWIPASYSGTGPVRYAAYTYSPNGNALSVTDANNNTTNQVYDGLNRLQFTLFPDPTFGAHTCTPPTSDAGTPSCTGQQPYNQQTYEQYAYDPNGNRVSLRTRRGDIISYHFNAANEMDLKSPAAQGAVAYGFNLAGDPVQIQKAAYGSLSAHSTAYTYDALGRKLSETNDGRAVAYQYDTLVSALDNAGSRTRTTWPDGFWVCYQYDPLHRLVSVRENSTSTNELAYYTYDALSRRQNLCLGDFATGSCPTGAWTNQVAYGYEPDSDLSALTHTLNGTVVGFNYAHNHSHQITTLSVNNAFYLPSPATAWSTGYAVNSLNEYTAVGGASVSSDLNGNLLTWTSSLPTPGTQTYTFDSENRLVTAAVAGSSTATVTYDYDPLGRRTRKSVNGTVTQYLLDADEEIAELDAAGNVLRRYVTGTAIDDRIAAIEGGTTSPPVSAHTFFHVNHQGSVIAMSDSAGNTSTCAAGTLCQLLAYDEYGNLSGSASATGQPFRFTGRRYDNETGLYYYRARYYSPQLGRFLQTDPVGYKDDLDLYTYVGNDPLDKTDPSGRVIEDFGIGEAIAACAASPPCAAAAIATAAYVTKAVVDIGKTIRDHSVHSEGSPPLPDKPVGDKPTEGSGNRTNSGPLTPENGGTGDAGKDFDKLTGGKSGPAPEGSNYPPGTRVGDNGIAHRPPAGDKGSRIDIPSNGDKSHETLHYPPPPPPPPKPPELR